MSREQILERILKNKPEAVPMPPSFTQGLIYDNKMKQFEYALDTVHATVAFYDNEAAFEAAFPEYFKDSTKIYSQLEKLHTYSADDPHDYECLDVAVYRGRVGVAENAAIFVDFGGEKERSQATLAQSLCLVLKEEDVVDNMHQAYDKVNEDFPDYGVFISGPSKTADIEQCLVVGAHGACALKVAIIKTA